MYHFCWHPECECVIVSACPYMDVVKTLKWYDFLDTVYSTKVNSVRGHIGSTYWGCPAHKTAPDFYFKLTVLSDNWNRKMELLVSSYLIKFKPWNIVINILLGHTCELSVDFHAVLFKGDNWYLLSQPAMFEVSGINRYHLSLFTRLYNLCEATRSVPVLITLFLSPGFGVKRQIFSPKKTVFELCKNLSSLLV